MTDLPLPKDELGPIVEMSDAEAWADMLVAAPAELAKEYGIRLVRLDSAALGMVAQVNLLLLNRTVGLGVLEPATEALVDAALKNYRSTDVKQYAIQTSPYAQPNTLPAWLEGRGLVPGGNWAMVVRDAKPPVEARTELRIQKIGVDYAGAFAEITCKTHGIPEQLQPWLIALVARPRWHHYLAFDDNKPVATAALFVDGNIGWTGFAGTLPAYRGRGAQTALLAQRVRDGVALGCQWFVSTCEEDVPDHPSPSYRNLLRNGFRLAYLRPNYTGKP